MTRFVLSDAARADVVAYVAYLRVQGTPEVAKRFRDGLNQAASRLVEMPQLGSPWGSDHPNLAGLRSWQVPGFPAVRIYYRVVGTSVRVARVLHGRRDIPRILGEKHQ